MKQAANESGRSGMVLTDYELLGFRGGQSRSAATAQAADAGFHNKGCTGHQYDFVDCNYSREGDEKLRLGFRAGVLVIVDYDCRIERYRRMRQMLIAHYGLPREVPANDGSKLSDRWGSLGDGQSLDMVERWDQTAGSFSLGYDEAKLAKVKGVSSDTTTNSMNAPAASRPASDVMAASIADPKRSRQLNADGLRLLSVSQPDFMERSISLRRPLRRIRLMSKLSIILDTFTAGLEISGPLRRRH